jgi:chorismate synthase
MLRFLTSGESHGPTLLAILDGMPAGLTLDIEAINTELSRRQKGYGRGARQKIETDQADFVGGVRHGVTTGSPIAIRIVNRDFDNWKHVMSTIKVNPDLAEVKEQLAKKSITRFRPGHADLSGTLKFRQADIRDVLERSSARETAARVAVGAVCQQLLKHFAVSLVAHVTQVGSIRAKAIHKSTPLSEVESLTMQSEMFCADDKATDEMKELIKQHWQEGDTLGGVIEVLADGLPVGLGSYTQWDARLDGQLAQALMSIQAMKAVEIGAGIEAASMKGSLVHDAMYPANNKELPFERKTNHAGGIEGGMTNGERLTLHAFMKPLPTLRNGLPSVDFPDFKADTAHFERSDVCAISAASIVCKAMTAFVLAKALLDKFGSDTIADIEAAITNYRKFCREPATYLRKKSLSSVADNEEAELE